MKIFLVRHGESISNMTPNIHQGQLDTKLSPKGEEQAKKIAHRLKDHSFDIIYTSDLLRASQTAHAIKEHHPVTQLIEDVRIREKSKGEFEGKERSIYKEDELEGDFFTRKPPGGENFLEHKERIKDFLDEILHKHENVLIVTHTWTIRILLHLLLKVPEHDLKEINMGNTSLYIVEVNEKEAICMLENCMIHLD